MMILFSATKLLKPPSRRQAGGSCGGRPPGYKQAMCCSRLSMHGLRVAIIVHSPSRLPTQ
ncbi:hypothetical protein NC652_033008 [Populus alba x Populus x berolinensis]|uniref:Uncharacterized protein n=1 Tax=Populus alba x Populus x berolinensis TaxID=444605 RepID=A0AAD6PZM7_9ROSI|nr:hypothetical protein NC652_032997 [Populus alba x Populus x berolinensis]KAJ6879579.1 hypothetical protein NC652_033008 [Populus alba x Populus x berolinensis]KAJ6972480.1 hypothetical protein NC653_032922 [Populus alba x Populus x berolinensis]KAJ6972485.1 hypothetical protein NC653_032925 [Populus alba x Populus x berolinensis]KAJ6972502.1 hypothetical protein NC653_032941 [Populus alba x Populus x berolinensis]